MAEERTAVMHSWCIQSGWNAPSIVGGYGARFRDAAGNVWIDAFSRGDPRPPASAHRRRDLANGLTCSTACRMPATGMRNDAFRIQPKRSGSR
jgi:hypothetical protein